MKLFELVVKEYLSIIESLENTEPIENKRIIIDRELFQKMLGKYTYMNFRDKCKIYKDLNFITHDKNNYSMPVKDKKTKKTVRKVVLNYSTYETIKYLFETDIKL